MRRALLAALLLSACAGPHAEETPAGLPDATPRYFLVCDATSDPGPDDHICAYRACLPVSRDAAGDTLWDCAGLPALRMTQAPAPRALRSVAMESRRTAAARLVKQATSMAALHSARGRSA